MDLNFLRHKKYLVVGPGVAKNAVSWTGTTSKKFYLPNLWLSGLPSPQNHLEGFSNVWGMASTQINSSRVSGRWWFQFMYLPKGCSHAAAMENPCFKSAHPDSRLVLLCYGDPWVWGAIDEGGKERTSCWGKGNEGWGMNGETHSEDRKLEKGCVICRWRELRRWGFRLFMWASWASIANWRQICFSTYHEWNSRYWNQGLTIELNKIFDKK